MKILKMLCFLVSMLISSVCFAGLKDYPAIAVLDFTKKAAVSAELTLDDAAMVTDFMIEELVDSNRFEVMEREQLKSIIDEQVLISGGMTNANTAVRIGQLTGVKYLVCGSVTGLSLKEDIAELENSKVGGASNNRHIVIANVSVRVVDVETGRIVLMGNGSGRSSSSVSEFTLKKDALTSTYSNTTNISSSSSDSDDDDSSSGTTTNKTIEYKTETTSVSNTIKFGTENVSQVQVHNALAKAARDAVYGQFGILTKLDGKSPRVAHKR